ncbi:FAD-dependent monooxygenase [Stackebrandtia nassauensis]|uniref:Monooxygenase FAD-binding protein n=1 Tax=Stackebrandtia nassauensis (strain DSM 44728 / CIP 108903 / NRRL B-16338 / NBRC 102104 / LLR-40K-21) TaxID=446470 RepID=D3Q9J5_STANL|nr:FAD-dependent monooxygenase [Stackebrandtia nassauensis]ADD42677.1 monooxygenase FAD-binding protein [Stackebrandtia nassauensis DSM 44728]
MTNRTALISGASIAGPALAYWLNHFGFDVTVVEAAPAPRPGGYKVDLRGVAVEAVDRMGIGEAVRARDTAIRGGQWVTTKGKTLATLGPDLIGFRDPGDLEIMRGDLSDLLREATERTVEYRYGDVITAIEDTPDAAIVHFRHAASQRFDIVVGADGLHSGTRAVAFGPEDRYSRPIGMSVAVFNAPNRLGLDHWDMACSATGHTTNLYAFGPDQPAYAQLFFPTPAEVPDRHDRAAQERVLREAFGGHGWELPHLLAALPEAPELYFDHLAQIHMDTWTSGRTVLLGDAAYCPSPASGQGTGMALVGAHVLAHALAAEPDHRAGFAVYERRMRHFVDINQKLGRDVAAKLVPNTRFAAMAQRVMMRMLPYMPGKNAVLEGVMKPIREAANAIALDETAPMSLR